MATLAKPLLLLCCLLQALQISHNFKAPSTNGALTIAAGGCYRIETQRARLHGVDRGTSSSVDSPAGRSTLLTTPLFYLNGELHVGHAYTLVAADVIKRFNHIIGSELTLLAGTDEHGTKIEHAASAAGKSPQAFVEQLRARFMEVQRAYGVSADINVHTSKEVHKEKVKQVLQRLLEQGDVYEGLHEGYFSPKEDAYYTEFQLVDGRSPQGFDVHRVAEKALFFRLSSYRDRLRELLARPGYILPVERQNEALELLSKPLPDVAVTRSNAGWGVPVMLDAFEGHTVYVWLDALLGYLTDRPSFPEEAGMVMLFGKDILRFIGLLWPALLMSLGRAPPSQLICHGWVLQDREKVSKSKDTKLLALPPPSGSSDVSRFVLMGMGAFGEDFHYDEARVANLSEFVRDKYANLTHRMTALMEKRAVESLVPDRHEEANALLVGLLGRLAPLHEAMRQYRLHRYVQLLDELALELNNYITEHRLWELSDTLEFRQHALALCQGLLVLTIYLYPLMPEMARQNLERLRPRLNGRLVELGSPVKVLESLKQIEFSPQHLGALM